MRVFAIWVVLLLFVAVSAVGGHRFIGSANGSIRIYAGAVSATLAGLNLRSPTSDIAGAGVACSTISTSNCYRAIYSLPAGMDGAIVRSIDCQLGALVGTTELGDKIDVCVAAPQAGDHLEEARELGCLEIIDLGRPGGASTAGLRAIRQVIDVPLQASETSIGVIFKNVVDTGDAETLSLNCSVWVTSL